MPNEFGANEFTAEELEELFGSTYQQETPPVETKTDAQTSNEEVTETKTETENVDTTKAFAKRLKEETEKVKKSERDAIAKELGFDSYDELRKDREEKLMTSKGLDPEQVSSVVDELVKARLEEDPRMAELNEYRKAKVKEFGEKELAEISKLTNGEISRFDQLPKEVLDLWTKKGSLKSAYLELEGEKLITKIRGEQSKGSTQHLNNPSGIINSDDKKRAMTDEEKRIYKMFNPNVSDEEINKKMIDK